MAELVTTTTETRRGEGSTQKTTQKAKEEQKRTQTPGKATRVREPVTNTQTKAAHEVVSRQEASESSQTQTEDYSIDVTFKILVRNFLGLGGSC